MHHGKIVGLATLALAALMAMTTTASATTYTSPTGTTYTGNYKYVNEGTVTLTSAFGGFGTIACGEATVEGKVETHGVSVTVGGKVSTLTLAKCTGGEVTSPVATPGSLETHSGGNLTSKSASIVIHKTLFGTCTFTTSSTGTSFGTITDSHTTGGHATLHGISIFSSACGNATLEATFTLVTPSRLYVD
jgi:hypothetical protein